MKISEIIQLEKENSGKIFLLKEGLFWRAYEYSAFLFVHNIKEYKCTKRFFKTINDYMVYIGFPENNLSEIIKIAKECMVIKEEKKIILKTNTNFDLEKYARWKAGIPVKNNKTTKENNIDIIKFLKEFDIVNKTPIECQNYLLKLKTMADGTV